MSLPLSIADSPSAALFGLVSRRQRWGLTLRGWVVVTLSGLVGLSISLLFVHPFLSLNAPVVTKTLVIEGWISQVGINMAAVETNTNKYDRVFVTGGPIGGFGGYISESNTYAHFGFNRLLKMGVPQDRLTSVPSRFTERDRTYSSALALRDYFQGNNVPPAAINVLTDSVHSRRSRLLFQSALGPEVTVGIIAVPPSDYRAERWWQYSAGVKNVFGESLAYAYARLFF